MDFWFDQAICPAFPLLGDLVWFSPAWSLRQVPYLLWRVINDKTYLLLACLVYWSQTFLGQNIKAAQSPVFHSAGHLQSWAAAEGSYETDSTTLDPVQRFII